MTKKEQAAMDAAILRAETLAALRWTTPVERDVPPPATSGVYSEGWDYNDYSLVVQQWWSGLVSHGTGPSPSAVDRFHSGASQGARSLFSSREKAVAAMRNAVEMNAAKRLLQIDRMLK